MSVRYSIALKRRPERTGLLIRRCVHGITHIYLGKSNTNIINIYNLTYKVIMNAKQKKGVPDYSKPTGKKFIDRSGEMHNHWLIESFSHRLLYTPASGRNQSTTYWNCLCTNCNQTRKAVPYHNLTSGASRSCGCAVVRDEKSSIALGERYGLLEVLSRNTKIKKTCAYWEVQCHSCGRVVNRNTRSVKTTQTCGHPRCRKLLNQLGEEASSHTFEES